MDENNDTKMMVSKGQVEKEIGQGAQLCMHTYARAYAHMHTPPTRPPTMHSESQFSHDG